MDGLRHDGRTHGFDPAGIERYRVDSDEARRHVRAWVEDGYRRARDAFGRGFGDDAPVPASLEAAIGVDPSRLAAEPEALLEAAEHVGLRLKRWLDDDAPPEVSEPVRTVSAVLARLLKQIAEPRSGEE